MEFSTALTIEAWTLWSIGMVLIAARMASRLMLLGSIKKLQADDWIMLFTILTFTGAVVSSIQVANNGSNYLPNGAAALLTPHEVTSAVYGSKMSLVLEEFTLFTTWQIKACILLFYNRLTTGLRQNIPVKIVAGYCVGGFILTQVLYLGVWCRPIQQYWAVPVHDSQCASYRNHMITATVFNVSSDVMMLLIPIPILIHVRLPLKRKLMLGALFSLGIFVILAALLNRYYNFSVPYSLIFLNWYVGELSTAVFVANIPLCWPLLRRVFRASTFADRNSEQEGMTRPRNPSPQHFGHGYTGRGKNGLRLGTEQRLPSQDDTIFGIGVSEEHLSGAEDWPIPKDQIKLYPLETNTDLQTNTHGCTSDNVTKEGILQKDGIVRTVQVTQYTV